jgi:hypothetical protein
MLDFKHFCFGINKFVWFLQDEIPKALVSLNLAELALKNDLLLSLKVIGFKDSELSPIPKHYLA